MFAFMGCVRCAGESELDAAAYAYLLGVYLGDGCLVRMPRTYGLRVFLDAAYPAIVDEVCGAVALVRGRSAGCRRDADRHMVTVQSYWNHWPCLFPQHGPGKKHHRPIVLADWQREIVRREPGRLLRGLIQTDGWRGENRVTSRGRSYSYPRYQFSNRSDDIRRIFCDACDELGVAWRPWGRWNVGVSRREAVALLDRHVGLKR
jgi:hypothetical protein